MNLERYERLKRQIEQAKAKRDRAVGAKQQLLQELKSRFKCSSIKEAKRRLIKIQRRTTKLESMLNKSVRKFEKRYYASIHPAETT